jgi:hypothetical protein
MLFIEYHPGLKDKRKPKKKKLGPKATPDDKAKYLLDSQQYAAILVELACNPDGNR